MRSVATSQQSILPNNFVDSDIPRKLKMKFILLNLLPVLLLTFEFPSLAAGMFSKE